MIELLRECQKEFAAIANSNPPFLGVRGTAAAMVARIHRTLHAFPTPPKAEAEGEMVERVARAIFASNCPHLRWEMRPEYHEKYLRAARAVLSAIRNGATKEDEGL